MSEVTVVVTACGRPDLLRKTIQSFLAHNTYPIAKWIITEDSGIADINKDVQHEYSDFTWVASSGRIGQIASIDRAYTLVTTPYVFHLEEDWETYTSGVIEESLTLLESNPAISAVMCRAPGDGGYVLSENPPFLNCFEPWGYYSFNPGLRRMKEYRELFGGSFSTFTSFDIKAPLKSEIAINNKFRETGMKMAMTAKGYLRHIGWGRHIGESLSLPSKIRIGLCMIVKDESHIIEETLRGILPLIDTYAITDTGSTDGTPELIQAFFTKHGIVGQVFHDTWEDFGTNRSRAMKNCEQVNMDYIIVIDADDLIQFPPNGKTILQEKLEKENPNQVLFVIRQGDLVQTRSQIFKNRDDWMQKGVLHEQPTNHKEGNRVAMLPPEFFMVSRRLGSRSKVEDKQKRDAEILEKALEKEPDNERYVFYLAQSYRDSGQIDKAVETQKKRFAMGRWIEEAWFSAQQVSKFTQDKEWAWKAHNHNPKRIECLHSQLAWSIANNKVTQETYAMAKQASTVPLPNDQHLFVETDVYTWRIWDALTLIAWITGHSDVAIECVNKLLREEKFPKEQLQRILFNRRLGPKPWEVPSDLAQRKAIWDTTLKLIQPPPKPKTIWANPSDAKLAIVMIEPRCHEDLEAVLRNAAHVYGGTSTALYVFHGTQNKKFVKQITKDWKNVQYRSIGKDNFTWQEYSEYLTKHEFWEQIETPHALIIQPDTLMFKPIPEKFFVYDFVGAPLHTQVNDLVFMNGGFSLRNVATMRAITKEHGPEYPKGSSGEDIYFLCRTKNRPTALEASEFSVEYFFRKNPVGVHKPWMYQTVENMKMLLSNTPGIKASTP